MAKNNSGEQVSVKNKGGRPRKYTEKLGREICKRIAEGESVRSIVKSEGMPSASSIFNWLLDEKYKTFLEQYETARNIQAELMFEEILEIADENHDDWMEVGKGKNKFEIPNKEVVMRSRLRVDTRKWYLSKIVPKKFGDKLDLTSGGDKLPTPIYGGQSVEKKD